MIVAMKKQLFQLDQNACRSIHSGAQTDVFALSDYGDLPRFGGI